jgi:hypothetical protein
MREITPPIARELLRALAEDDARELRALQPSVDEASLRDEFLSQLPAVHLRASLARMLATPRLRPSAIH